MGKLEDFIGCTIKRDLAKMTLKVSQLDLINKMMQGLNGELKSQINFNNPATTHQGVVRNQ